MAISECPSRETYLAADISLIVENLVSLLLSWGSGVLEGCEVGIMANPSSAHLIFGLLRPAAKVLSLGFGFGLMCVLGKQRVASRKTMLRRFAAGLWGLCG